jgi:hypothetical protein
VAAAATTTTAAAAADDGDDLVVLRRELLRLPRAVAVSLEQRVLDMHVTWTMQQNAVLTCVEGARATMAEHV